MTSEKRDRIREGLRQHYGGLEKVIARTSSLKQGGYSRRYIQYVLEGKRANLDILRIATEVLTELRGERNRKEAEVAAAYYRVEALA